MKNYDINRMNLLQLANMWEITCKHSHQILYYLVLLDKISNTVHKNVKESLLMGHGINVAYYSRSLNSITTNI